MNKAYLIAVLLLLTAASCKKIDVTKPAVVANIYSISYPPGEDNPLVYTATVELRKTDGSYSQIQYSYGTGQVTFEDLGPGEYWINEETSRQSETFILSANEKREIDFIIP